NTFSRTSALPLMTVTPVSRLVMVIWYEPACLPSTWMVNSRTSDSAGGGGRNAAQNKNPRALRDPPRIAAFLPLHLFSSISLLLSVDREHCPQSCAGDVADRGL